MFIIHWRLQGTKILYHEQISHKNIQRWIFSKLRYRLISSHWSKSTVAVVTKLIISNLATTAMLTTEFLQLFIEQVRPNRVTSTSTSRHGWGECTNCKFYATTSFKRTRARELYNWEKRIQSEDQAIVEGCVLPVSNPILPAFLLHGRSGILKFWWWMSNVLSTLRVFASNKLGPAKF